MVKSLPTARTVFVFLQGAHSGFMKEPTAGELEDIVRTTGLRSAWAIAEEAKRQQMEGREASGYTMRYEEETPQQRAAKQRAADAAMQKLLGTSPSLARQLKRMQMLSLLSYQGNCLASVTDRPCSVSGFLTNYTAIHFLRRLSCIKQDICNLGKAAVVRMHDHSSCSHSCSRKLLRSKSCTNCRCTNAGYAA